jgi:hypothetical protein
VEASSRSDCGVNIWDSIEFWTGFDLDDWPDLIIQIRRFTRIFVFFYRISLVQSFRSEILNFVFGFFYWFFFCITDRGLLVLWSAPWWNRALHRVSLFNFTSSLAFCLLESRGGCDDFVMIITMQNYSEGDFDLKRAISVVRLFGQNFSIQIAKTAFSD